MSKITVEYFYAGGCARCAEARDALRGAAESVAGVEWVEVDVGKNPDRAVDHGIVATPAVVINGHLAFSTAPTPLQLRTAVQSHVAKA